jgi:hypothetical protein
MYLYLGSLRLTTYSAFVGGLIFMVCGFMTAAPNTTVFVAEVYGYVGLLPLTLALAGIAAWRTVRREVRFWIVVAALGFINSI